jgi:hypothetical protein
MDEQVHTFATEILPPLNTRVRSDMPFIPNGSDDKAFTGSASLHEKKHHRKHHKNPDIAERNMDAEAYGFANDNVSQINEIEHSKKAPEMNGKMSRAQTKLKAKDMSEGGMDPEVFGFASEMVSAINA